MSSKWIASTLSAAAGLLIAGCPLEPGETENQGGGSILTAGLKILNGSLSGLTPDEVQIIAERVEQRKPNLIVDVTDEQAAAIVEFLQSNNLNSIAAVSAVIQNPQGLVIPESLNVLIEAGDLPDIQRRPPTGTLQTEAAGGTTATGTTP